MDISVRRATADDLAAVAGLRWLAARESGRVADIAEAGFVHGFTEWAGRHRDSHHCTVLLRGEAVIGAAWLAVLPRVPHPGSLERIDADVQSVYVVPHERNAGLGQRLLTAVLAHARELGAERVTVHSSERAVTAYRRLGFAVAPTLMQAEV